MPALDDARTTHRGAPRARPGRLTLLVIGETVSSSYPLPEAGELVIGRGRAADIAIEDTSISRRHAILRIGSSITIEDLGSANGTRVRGEAAPATRAIAVEVGDVIDTGSVMLGPPAPAPADPPASRPGKRARRAVDSDEIAELRRRIAELERERILEALDRCGGNQTRAARLLGMPRRTLVTRLGKYDVPRPRKGVTCRPQRRRPGRARAAWRSACSISTASSSRPSSSRRSPTASDLEGRDLRAVIAAYPERAARFVAALRNTPGAPDFDPTTGRHPALPRRTTPRGAATRRARHS